MLGRRECYIAGPMRGIPLWNFPAFDRWRDALLAAGWIVHSPADMDRGLGLDENDYPDLPEWFTMESALIRDFERILLCAHANENGYGAIILLPGFEKSSGAHAELNVSKNTGVHALLAVEDEDGNPLCLPELEADSIGELLAQGPGKLPFATDRLPGAAEGFARLADHDCPTAEHGCSIIGNPPPVMGRGESSVLDYLQVVGERPLGEVRHTSVTGGQKGQKAAQLGAIDPVALLAVARVAGMGADKYARYNYLNGYPWSLIYDAADRHILLSLAGQDYDEESGLPHLAHAAWNCLTGVSFLLRDLGTDDRPKAAARELLHKLLFERFEG